MIDSSILFVSQDPSLATKIKSKMKSKGYEVQRQDDSSKAVTIVNEKPPALVLLEKALPNRSGFSICQEMRKNYGGPLIFLTDEKNDVDELFAFEIGADDYIDRAVLPDILIARMTALLKRTEINPMHSKSAVNIGDLTVMPSRREAFVSGQAMRLTSIQFDLLWYMVKHSGTVVSRNDLSQLLYDTDYNGIDRSIDVYISRIRNKLGDDPTNPVYLKTVRGVGYLFAGP